MKNLCSPIFDLCLCGCNNIVYGGRQYLHGHNFKNKKRSSQNCANISKALTGKKCPWHAGDKNPAKRLDVRIKISQTECGKIVSDETKRKLSEAHKGIKPSEKTKALWRKQRKLDGNSAWKGGVSFEPYCPKFNEQKREEIRNQYGRRCAMCNKNEIDNLAKNGKIWKLSVHHIDLDKEQGCNGKQWKLVPLCMYCHSKIHFKKLIHIE